MYATKAGYVTLRYPYRAAICLSPETWGCHLERSEEPALSVAKGSPLSRQCCSLLSKFLSRYSEEPALSEAKGSLSTATEMLRSTLHRLRAGSQHDTRAMYGCSTVRQPMKSDSAGENNIWGEEQ